MRFQANPVYVTAYKIKSFPLDIDGNRVVDGEGNVTVQVGDDLSAETIPFVFTEDQLKDYAVGDFIVAGDEGAQLEKYDAFMSAYKSA